MFVQTVQNFKLNTRNRITEFDVDPFTCDVCRSGLANEKSLNSLEMSWVVLAILKLSSLGSSTKQIASKEIPEVDEFPFIWD